MEDKTSGIALPIYLKGRVVACINLVWVLTAFDEAAFVARYLPKLRTAAASIERRLDDQAPSFPD